jgi:hypothetical protein
VVIIEPTTYICIKYDFGTSKSATFTSFFNSILLRKSSFTIFTVTRFLPWQARLSRNGINGNVKAEIARRKYTAENSLEK